MVYIVDCCCCVIHQQQLVKGRSSAHRLLRPFRSMAALLLAANVYVVVKWLPSALNPADGASRLRQ
jgi:hypothetical protein